jgi:hypothetical protein
MEKINYQNLNETQQNAVKVIAMELGRVGSKISSTNDVCEKFEVLEVEIERCQLLAQIRLDNLNRTKILLSKLKKSLKQ